MATVERILIVGGGIAGLTLAAALRQQGYSPQLIERSPNWQTNGAGISVQPNGVRVLHALGLGAAVERFGTSIRHWDYSNERGEVLCDTDLVELWGGVGPFVGIARRELQQVLLTGIAAVPCRLGTSIVALRQDEHRVTVTYSDGTTGDHDLVVGADGLASTTRQLALSTALPIYGGQMTWRSLAPIRPRGLTSLRFLLGDGCFFGLCPVGGGQTYGFANVSQPRFHDDIQGRRERLRQRFAAFGGAIQDYLVALDSDEQIHCSAVEWVEQVHWYSGRVVLVGDAAHAASPMMGQGGSLAMEDAWVLAEVLRAAENIENALAAYVARRTPRVEWVRQQSRNVAETFRLPPTARNDALREHGDQGMHDRYLPLVPAP